MKTQPLTLHAVRRPRTEGWRVSTIFNQLRRWKELYQQRRALASLGEETLKDLGLSRADVEREASRPFWDDPQSPR